MEGKDHLLDPACLGLALDGPKGPLLDPLLGFVVSVNMVENTISRPFVILIN